MTVPDSIQEVTGYRIWEVTKSLRLRSYNAGYGYWQPGINEAMCMVPPPFARRNGENGLELVPLQDAHGPIPDPECSCGFWMLNSIGRLHEQGLLAPRDSGYGVVTWSPWAAGNSHTEEPSIGRVAGSVKGWGRTIVAGKGHRCQYVELVSLLVAGDEDALFYDQLRKVAATYGVPIEQSDKVKVRPNEYPTVFTTGTTVTWTTSTAGGSWVGLDPAGAESVEDRNKRSKEERRKSLDQMRQRHHRRGQLP